MQEQVVAESGSRLLTTAEIEQFEALSIELFGASSKWSTILKKGMTVPVTEKVTEYVPATDTTPEETKEVDVPVYLTQNKKSVKQVTKHFTAESLLAWMLDRKKQIDTIKALIKKRQDDAEAARKEAQVAKQLSDSLSMNATGDAK